MFGFDRVVEQNLHSGFRDIDIILIMISPCWLTMQVSRNALGACSLHWLEDGWSSQGLTDGPIHISASFGFW